ncbi:hypothetical protein [Desulfosarcina ovata]|uniref:Uncharacterized protein n=1 Tax=Desulfosarcina ovata subsp. ovata TaxID=2752305 RepID=A0A5K8A649_9BACT|nr:hypothetical protein [Desulfosarcina ovata]BBO87995.1 hypothetical protein DSCOOX_11750 [Desulfosarcina ovata subsp. ovata]
MPKDENINAIPIGSNASAGTRTYFKNIVDAISQIQQFAVMERSDYEIPEDFLTLRGSLNFFSIGFGNGFIEGMVFALLLAIIMPLTHSEYLMELVSLSFPLARSRAFLWMLNLLPVIIAVTLCSYLSRYRIGKIAKRAVDALLVGRMFSLIIKAIIIFVLLIAFYNYNDVVAYGLGRALAKINVGFGHGVFLTISRMKEHLLITAFRILAIFAGAILAPFFTIWLVSLYRAYQRKKAERFWME